MPKQSNPWAAIDERVSGAKTQQPAPTLMSQNTGGGLINLEGQGYNNLWFSRAGRYDQSHKGTYGNQHSRELLAGLNKQPFGFKPQVSAGYANIGHSNGKGGEHVDPGVFDLGLSGRTPKEAEKLKNYLTSQGVDFLEEGRGTGNWHLHVRGKKGQKQKPPATSAPLTAKAQPIQDMLIPSIPKGATVVPIEGMGFDIPTRAQTAASNTARTNALIPAVPENPVPASPDKGNPWGLIDEKVAAASQPKAAPVAAKPESNFLTDLTGAYQNAVEGYTRDDLVNQSGGGWGAGLGNIAGGLTYVGGGALAGGIAGSIVPGAGTAGGAIGGGVAGGISQGALSEAQRERLAGEQYDMLKLAGAGAIGGVSALPVGGVASTLGRTVLKNAAIDSGINAAGDVALQAVEKGTLDPRQIDLGRAAQAAAIGAGGGAIGGGLAYKGRPQVDMTPTTATNTIDPITGKPYGGLEVRTKPSESAFSDAAQADSAYQKATKERINLDNTIQKQYKTPDGAEVRLAELEAKVNSRTANPVEYKEYQQVKGLVDQQGLVRSTADEANQRSIDMTQVQKRSELPEIIEMEKNKPNPLSLETRIGIENSMKRPVPMDMLKGVDQELETGLRSVDTAGKGLETIDPMAPKTSVDLTAPRGLTEQPSPPRDMTQPSNVVEMAPNKGVHTTPEGGEVFTHGRTPEEVKASLAGVQDQVVALSEIRQRFKGTPVDTHALNVLDSGERSEAVKLSYIAREEPNAPQRVRDNFVPTHFTNKTISPNTERAYLRRKFGDDAAVVSHLKQRIVEEGGSVNAALLRNKKGGERGSAVQINRLIEALDNQMKGNYLKSPRVHGFNLGESTRTGATDRGIRLDTITESSLTGRKVSAADVQKADASAKYNNQMATTKELFKAIQDDPNIPPEVKRTVTKITETSNATFNDIRKMRKSISEHLEQFCNIWGLK